jgi:predicted peptidase
MKKIAPLVLLLLFFQAVSAQKLELYEKKLFMNGKDTLRYRILYPENYKKRKPYPVIVFLHGSGERGRDNEAQLTHGGKLFVREDIRQNFPAIVIFPQCPPDSAWAKTKRIQGSDQRIFLSDEAPSLPSRLVKELMDSLSGRRVVNTKRIYLGGLSLGGFGTYDMLIRYPGYFAAAFPICGACNIPLFLKRARNTPLWIFHGALDKSVPPTSDRELYKALMTRGATNVRYTEYPQAGHNSWDSAFAEPKLLPWLFSDRKRKKNRSN